MTRLLEQVVKDLRTLSLEEQDRVAEVVATYLNGSQEDLRLVA
jgi:tRNA uridine 5-carbamoylmethylation protein Kti12